MKKITQVLSKGIAIILFAILLGANVHIGSENNLKSNELSIINKAKADTYGFCLPKIRVCLKDDTLDLIIMGDFVAIPIEY